MNHFVYVGPNGGYIGRYSWVNTAPLHGWGSTNWLRRNILATGWIGEIGMIRYLVRCS